MLIWTQTFLLWPWGALRALNRARFVFHCSHKLKPILWFALESVKKALFYWTLSFTLTNRSTPFINYIIYRLWCLDFLRDVPKGTVMIYELSLLFLFMYVDYPCTHSLLLLLANLCSATACVLQRVNFSFQHNHFDCSHCLKRKKEQ